MFSSNRCVLTLAMLGLFLSPTQAVEWPPADPVVVQLYVFGEPALKPGDPLKEVFETVRGAGYHQIQSWLDYFQSEESGETLQDLLDEYHLKMVAAYTPGTMHDQARADEAIQTILRKARIGARHGLQLVIINPDQTPKPKTDEELKVQVKNLNRLGAELKKIGLKLAVHQHDQPMQEGAREWYYDLRNTEPDKVSICLDVHWILRGGQDPYQLVKDAGKRIADLHLRNSVEGHWTESLGEGEIDYQRVADILKSFDYQGYLTVELAREKGTVVTKSLLENLKDSRAYVKKVFGK